MRALVTHPGPQFSVADVHTGLVNGLGQCGIPTISFNLDERLNFYVGAHMLRDGEFVKAFDYESACRLAAQGIKAACFDYFGPDPRDNLLIVSSGFYVPPEMYAVLRAHAHVVIWMTESPYEDDRQLLQAPYADTVIINDPTNLDRFREVNPRTYYIPHGYDPDIHHPQGRRHEPAVDFTFVGTGYQSRIDFLEKVDWDGITASLHGNWKQLAEDSPIRRFAPEELDQCIDNPDTAAVYRGAKMSANLYRLEAERPELETGWSMGPREVELAAVGTFMLRQPRGEGDEVLWMLPTFTEPGELGDLIRWWSHPSRNDQRTHLTNLAREAVADRTFKNNAANLLRLISS